MKKPHRVQSAGLKGFDLYQDEPMSSPEYTATESGSNGNPGSYLTTRPMTRLQKLKECLEIAIRNKNPYMAQNLREAISAEESKPSLNSEDYPEA